VSDTEAAAGATFRSRVADLVARLYPHRAAEVTDRLVDLVAGRRGPGHPPLSERTAYLITYGDAVRRPGERPLHTLATVLRDHVGDLVSGVHLLPMFPWTSDDGFAVVDHRQVNPALGSWADVAELAADHDLMFDFVANHVSSSSGWFQGWLAGDPAYGGFFLERDPGFDTSAVVRPRVSPLHHRYERPGGGEVEAWTTFGADQVDVNVASPEVLLELTDVLLGYLERGASAIRLDAIGYLWKESGTSSIHLPQTHAVVKVWRAVVDHIAPGTLLLTETNVPHAENVSYFGAGDEAHMVYQFALPPLVLHAFVAGDTTRLSQWASGIGPVGPRMTWFNFLASHDGIGMTPAQGLLDDDEVAALVDRAVAHGGRVSMAARPDGSERVYELNVSYLDALSTPQEVGDDALAAAKAVAAHSILVSFVGVPAIYYHSLFGSRSDVAGMAASGINRRINRAVLDADTLGEELRTDPRRRAVFDGLGRLLRTRAAQPGLAPDASQAVELLDPRVFAVRRAAGTPDELVCVTNVTGDRVRLADVSGTDVLTGDVVAPLVLGPYGYAWVRPGR
jgi:sucrose phosphorylase